MNARTWLRAGMVLLVVIETVIGVWQYFFSLSFYTDFPTVSLDPPADAVENLTVLGIDAVLPIVLLFLARATRPTPASMLHS